MKFICNQCGKEFARNPDVCDNCNTIVTTDTFRKEHDIPKENEQAQTLLTIQEVLEFGIFVVEQTQLGNLDPIDKLLSYWLTLQTREV